MITVTRTVRLDGHDKPEYDAIIAHLEATNSEAAGWTLLKEPLLHRVTATKTETIESI